MERVINLGIPHVGELIFESFDTPELINCMEVSETWRELAGNVLIKRRKGKIYMQIFEAFKSGETKVAQQLLKRLGDDALFQCALVSKTWKILVDQVLMKRWNKKMFEACQNGETKVVQLLLERYNFEENGLNFQDELGATPFMWACNYGHKNVVQLLLDHSERIDLNARNFCNWSPKPLSSFFGKTALTIAHQRGHQDIVQMVKPKSSFCSQFSFFYPDMFEFLLILAFSFVFAIVISFFLFLILLLSLNV